MAYIGTGVVGLERRGVRICDGGFGFVCAVLLALTGLLEVGETGE